jgi:site-specific DNA-methyltransferase (adenine-specific)
VANWVLGAQTTRDIQWTYQLIMPLLCGFGCVLAAAPEINNSKEIDINYQILQGDNRETLKTLPDNSIDAIVTDPPYGIDFLGKAWDANTGALETYQECLRVLKPGGHILAFSAARTYHHLAVTLEQAGFEIRDQIMWIYSSGFPKSQDIGRSIQRSIGVKQTRKVKDDGSKAKHYDYGMKKSNENDQVVVTDPEAQQWEGWGTALKPAHEPIALARKPLHKNNSIARNCQQWGVGAINIDATRVGYEGEKDLEQTKNWSNKEKGKARHKYFDAQTDNTKSDYDKVDTFSNQGRFPSNVLGDIAEPYQKYFYCPKVSRAERHIGFETPPAMFGNMKGCYDENGERFAVGFDNRAEGVISNDEMLAKMGGYFINELGNKKETQDGSNMLWLPHTGNIYIHGLKHEYQKWCKANGIELGNVGNNHPTVKPVALMEYLIKLITPPGGTVLDPFNGSGSTGMAAVGLGYNYIGCELDPAYVDIANRRIAAWLARDPIANSGLFDME